MQIDHNSNSKVDLYIKMFWCSLIKTDSTRKYFTMCSKILNLKFPNFGKLYQIKRKLLEIHLQKFNWQSQKIFLEICKKKMIPICFGSYCYSTKQCN